MMNLMLHRLQPSRGTVNFISAQLYIGVNIEQTTPGAPGVGTHYREVVQMVPLVHGEILSVITRFEPNEHLEEDFEGAGFKGHLAYHFLSEDDGTRLIQRETMSAQGFLKVLEPVIVRVFFHHLRERLEAIKAILESA
jgi:hypothetical protein